MIFLRFYSKHFPGQLIEKLEQPLKANPIYSGSLAWLTLWLATFCLNPFKARMDSLIVNEVFLLYSDTACSISWIHTTGLVKGIKMAFIDNDFTLN